MWKSSINNYKWQEKQQEKQNRSYYSSHFDLEKNFKKFCHKIPLNYIKWWNYLSEDEKRNLYRLCKGNDKIKVFEQYQNIYPKDKAARRELILDKIL